MPSIPQTRRHQKFPNEQEIKENEERCECKNINPELYFHFQKKSSTTYLMVKLDQPHNMYSIKWNKLIHQKYEKKILYRSMMYLRQ